MRMTRLTLAIWLPRARAEARWWLGSADLVARLAGRLGVGVAVDHEAVLEERVAPPAQPLESHALLEPRVRRRVTGRVLPEEVIPGLNGLGKLLLRVQALADPVLRVVGELRVGVVAQVLLVALDGQVVVAAGVVGVGLAVELARWRHSRGRRGRGRVRHHGSRRRWGSARRVDRGPRGARGGCRARGRG